MLWEVRKNLPFFRLMKYNVSNKLEISADKAASRIDDEMSVLIEGYLYEDDIYIGRTYMDAPKVDGNVFVRAEEELISGDIVPVRITGANEYDLMGDVIYADEFTE